MFSLGKAITISLICTLLFLCIIVVAPNALSVVRQHTPEVLGKNAVNAWCDERYWGSDRRYLNRCGDRWSARAAFLNACDFAKDELKRLADSLEEPTAKGIEGEITGNMALLELQNFNRRMRSGDCAKLTDPSALDLTRCRQYREEDDDFQRQMTQYENDLENLPAVIRARTETREKNIVYLRQKLSEANSLHFEPWRLCSYRPL